MDKGCKTCAFDGVLAYQNTCKRCVASGTLEGWTIRTCANCKYGSLPHDEEPCKICFVKSNSPM